MDYKLLKSERLIYRQFTDSDYDDLFTIMSNPNVRRFLPGDGPFNELKTKACLGSFSRSFLIEKPDLVYALVLKGTTKVIGYTGVAHVKEYDLPEILYGLNEDYWNKGFATEAALRMKQLAVELDLDTIIAFTDIRNQPSELIIYKLGYKYIKTIDLWGLNLKYYELNLKGEQK